MSGSTTLPLTASTLTRLDERISRPGFDRAALTPAIVHLGVGGFHRAHQAVYLDDLARDGCTGWGEIGVGLRSPAMRDALIPQDCLFTVVERGPGADRARVVGAMVDYRFGPDDPGAVLAALTDPRTRVVTLTVTGNAYHVDGGGGFQPTAPGVPGDPAGPRRPSTVLGYLVAALDRRRRLGLPAVTVLSCDNVPDNGNAARAAVVGFAKLWDRRLAAWIDAHAAFPGSMVDRITPATDDAARELVARRFGVRDRWPVVTEPFSQWVIEDRFCNGRPPLDQVGVRFVGDVTPYRLMKTRLLNACHSALGYLGTLTGRCRTTSEAMANRVFVDYLTVLMRREIAPLLPPVPGVDLDGYQRSVLDRLANPRISDRLSRLCERGTTKMPAYVLPSLAEARRRGRPTALLTLAVAAWICHLRGVDANGDRIDGPDAPPDRLSGPAASGDVRALLAERSLFGELADDAQFADALDWAVRELQRRGPVATIREHLSPGLLQTAA